MIQQLFVPWSGKGIVPWIATMLSRDENYAGQKSASRLYYKSKVLGKNKYSGGRGLGEGIRMAKAENNETEAETHTVSEKTPWK